MSEILNEENAIVQESATKMVEYGSLCGQNTAAGEESEEEYEEGFKIFKLLKAYRKKDDMTTSELEALLACLRKLSEGDSFPSISPLIGQTLSTPVRRGSTGPTGPQGTQGSQGTRGSIGSTGQQGTQGTQGSIGPTGSAGNQGATGPQGTQGSIGPQGTQGSQGSIGPTGAQGATGPTAIRSVATGATAPQLYYNVISIGDWNMRATGANASHGIPDFKKIRSIDVMIRDDSDSLYIPLNGMNVGTQTLNGGIGYYDGTIINLQRAPGGQFDNNSYDSTSYNRGYITIIYEA